MRMRVDDTVRSASAVSLAHLLCVVRRSHESLSESGWNASERGGGSTAPAPARDGLAVEKCKRLQRHLL